MQSMGFYLVVGSFSMVLPFEPQITNAGSVTKRKSLRSGPDNWEKITQLLRDAELDGVILKLTGDDFNLIHSDRYRIVATELISALGNVPHLVIVHEQVYFDNAPLASDTTVEEIEDDDEIPDWGEYYQMWPEFPPISPDTRAAVRKEFEDAGATLTSYRTNREAAALAAAFIEDTRNHLLFRIYVPSGRLYEDELARLLTLFDEWLSSVKGRTVRQGGYRTRRGRVFEFFGEPGMTRAAFDSELREFTSFMDAVGERPEDAQSMLEAIGLDPERATLVADRYRKEARRVQLDVRQDRERRMLAIHHQLEADLTDEASDASPTEIKALVQKLVPMSPFELVDAGRESLAGGGVVIHQQIVGQQQIITRVEGVVAQNVYGGVQTGTNAEHLIKLVRELGGESNDVLETAAQEIDDPDSPLPAKVRAGQRLKEFLKRNAGRVEDASFKVLWAWIESQIGIGGT